jgi:hypothetical protein
MATLESWSDVMYSGAATTEVGQQPVAFANPAACLYFVFFVIVGAFFLLNLVIGEKGGGGGGAEERGRRRDGEATGMQRRGWPASRGVCGMAGRRRVAGFRLSHSPHPCVTPGRVSSEGVSIDKFNTMRRSNNGGNPYLSDEQEAWVTTQKMLTQLRPLRPRVVPHNALRAFFFRRERRAGQGVPCLAG